MDGEGKSSSKNSMMNMEDDMDLRRGPWTVDEDFKLINYIATHGEGRWNSLARCAGLKRTGKSCRLRWLNYLRPDVRRGNITLEEQLMILELHSRWGNRWSKIAQYLPGRTDNEIKNYWRTRVQKHAKQLKCDVNSKQFKDTMRYLWMPRLVERIQAAATATTTSAGTATSATSSANTASENLPMSSMLCEVDDMGSDHNLYGANTMNINYSGSTQVKMGNTNNYTTPENSSMAVSPTSDLTEYHGVPVNNDPNPEYFQGGVGQMEYYSENLNGPTSQDYFDYGGLYDFQGVEQSNVWFDAGDPSESLWNVDQDFWSLLQQLNNGSS